MLAESGCFLFPPLLPMQAVGRRLAAAARGLSGAPRAAPVSVAGVHARSALIAAHHSAIPAHGLGAVASRRLLVAASPPGAWAGGLLGPGAARALGPAVRPWLAPPLGAEQTRGMRHGQRRGKLGRSATDRWALLRNMVTDLIKHERIQTTVPKAKELKRLADKVITIGKQGTLMARRRAGAILRTDESIRKLFGVLAPRYRERDGGYTRVLRCINNRKGDNAPMAWIEYVDREGELRTCKAPVKRLPYAKRLHHAQAKGDERLVEYFTEMQGRELEAAAARAARIQAKKIRIRGPDGLD